MLLRSRPLVRQCCSAPGGTTGALTGAEPPDALEPAARHCDKLNHVKRFPASELQVIKRKCLELTPLFFSVECLLVGYCNPVTKRG